MGCHGVAVVKLPKLCRVDCDDASRLPSIRKVIRPSSRLIRVPKSRLASPKVLVLCSELDAIPVVNYRSTSRKTLTTFKRRGS